MAYKELYNQVLHLGFEDTALESDVAYVDAVNRAIYQVNALRPRIAYKDILHFPQKDMLGGRYTKLTEVVNGSVSFPVSGCKEFVISIAGEGTIYLCKSNGNKTPKVIPRDFETVVISLNGEDTVTIQTSTRFVYENAAAYLVPHPNKSALPNTHYTAYNIPNAMALHNPPISKTEGYKYIADGYRVEGTTLLINNELAGIYRVAYYASPTNLTEDAIMSESFIPLDEDLCALLPLVIASYIWLEDDADLSQLYYNRYAEQAQMILKKGREQTPTKYVTNGW